MTDFDQPCLYSTILKFSLVTCLLRLNRKIRCISIVRRWRFVDKELLQFVRGKLFDFLTLLGWVRLIKRTNWLTSLLFDNSITLTIEQSGIELVDCLKNNPTVIVWSTICTLKLSVNERRVLVNVLDIFSGRHFASWLSEQELSYPHLSTQAASQTWCPRLLQGKVVVIGSHPWPVVSSIAPCEREKFFLRPFL